MNGARGANVQPPPRGGSVGKARRAHLHEDHVVELESFDLLDFRHLDSRGEGEVVLVATGSSSRQTHFTQDKPVDAVIMAIVDKLDISIKQLIEESAD